MTKTNSQTATKTRAAKAKALDERSALNKEYAALKREQAKLEKIGDGRGAKVAEQRMAEIGDRLAEMEATPARTKKVLTEKDIPIGKLPTAKELRDQTERELRQISSETGAPRANAAKLATGVDGRNSPHSAKAVADSRAKATTKADKVQATKAAKAEKKAEKRSRASGDQSITVLVTAKDVTVKGGRLAKVLAVIKRKPKTAADILGTEVVDDSGKSHKIDMGALHGMVRRGHIKLG